MTIASDTVIDTYGIDGQVHFELNEDFNLVSRFMENGSDQEILLQDIPKELSDISDINLLKRYLVKTHSKMSESSDGSLHLDIYRKLDGGNPLVLFGIIGVVTTVMMVIDILNIGEKEEKRKKESSTNNDEHSTCIVTKDISFDFEHHHHTYR